MNLQRRYKQKRFYYIGLFICLALLGYLYIGKGVQEAKEVFSYSDAYASIEEEKMDNIFIFILNNTMPALKVAYEGYKGVDVDGINGFITDEIASLPSRFLKNPLNFFKFSYSGFLEIDEDKLSASQAMGEGIPDIKSFSDVPEGDIYFSEEDEYTAEELENFDHLLNNEGSNEPVEEYAPNIPSPDKVELSKNSPQILIYHSHATESYMPNTASNYHTLTEKYNVVSVGSTLAKVLQDKYKYKVIHDKTYHDKDSYAYSYSNSLATIKKHMSKYSSIKVIIDIHRDAFPAENERVKAARKSDYTVNINGKKAARVMLVIGNKNPNYSELEKFAAYIKKKMDTLYPGLYLKTERANAKYNQYFSNYSILIEIGCMLNTIEEAHYSAELMGNVLGEVLNELRE